MANAGTVLVVDDDPTVVDGYAANLRERYSVRTAYSGQEALDSLDEAVDVVLLDRRMPGLSGDEVLKHIRGRELNCRVAMVTAVTPNVDIIEMGFDDYLIKPVSREDLFATVERLLARATYDEQIQEYFSLVSKRTVLAQENREEVLQNQEKFTGLTEEIRRLERDLDDTLSQLDDEDTVLLFDP